MERDGGVWERGEHFRGEVEPGGGGGDGVGGIAACVDRLVAFVVLGVVVALHVVREREVAELLATVTVIVPPAVVAAKATPVT